jgi:hypothetical protein
MTPTDTVIESSSDVCGRKGREGVGNGLQGVFSDEAREAAIQLAAKAVERHFAAWESTGDFQAHAMAHRARSSMEALIRGRSPEQVLKMERERGFL